MTDPTIWRTWTPKPQVTVSEWADAHRFLDSSFNAEPGPWQTSRVPYAREWMDTANCRWVRHLSLMTGTQVSKTETLNNLIGYHIQHDPCPIMLVMPRRDDAKLAMQRRLLPMVEASASLREQRTGRQDDLQTREMVFRRCIVYLRAAQSPADLASVPVRLVCADEVDKFPDWSGKEASPLDLLEERTRTFYDHLIVCASTPTTRDGNICQLFEDGDQRRYWVPCPHCQWLQVFEWHRVKWDKATVTTAREMEDARHAWYECARCEQQIDDRGKIEMLARGWWVPTGHDAMQWRNVESKEERHPHRSYHLWAAYSPWVQWWQIVAKWMASRDVPKRFQNFVNSWLAEVWEERVQNTTDAAVTACVGTHKLGEVPADAKAITATVDVQVDRMEYHLQAWGMDEESWLVGVGRTNDWNELGDILFRNLYGPQQLRVHCCLVDSRYRRPEVLDFCRDWQPVARMIAGVEREGSVPFGTKKLDKHPRTGAPLPNSMTVWTVNVDWFKDLIAQRMQQALAEPESRAGRLWLPSDLDAASLKQLASEHKVKQRSGNREAMRWVKKPGHQRNEAWDLQVYQAAAARLSRIDTLRTERKQFAKRPAPDATAPPPRRQQNQRRRGPRFPTLGGR
jgi:phage terminase large subunit GpA-like protein